MKALQNNYANYVHRFCFNNDFFKWKIETFTATVKTVECVETGMFWVVLEWYDLKKKIVPL